MILDDRQKLRAAALVARNATRAKVTELRTALAGKWEIQTSNSFRRIGAYGDGDVLSAVTQRSDGHSDLLAPPGVLDYVIAAQPDVVLELLDYVDVIEQRLDRLDEIERHLMTLRTAVETTLKEISR